MSGPYVRVSADAQRVAVFSLESVPDFPHDNSHIEEIAAGPNGEVQLLAWEGDGHYLITYNNDGRFLSATKVDLRLFVSHFAVFPSGQILVAGEKLPRKAGDLAGVPLNVILDRNGKVVKELELPGDVQPDPSRPANQQGKEISGGRAVTGDDGNIYLMRATQNPLIFVISPALKITRKLSLVPPAQDFKGGNFSVVQGKIFMEFLKLTGSLLKHGSLVYSVYDAQTGEHQVDYEQMPNSFGMLACATPDGFTFLSSDGNKLSIVHASPR
jgi:hypothetical protein